MIKNIKDVKLSSEYLKCPKNVSLLTSVSVFFPSFYFSFVVTIDKSLGQNNYCKINWRKNAITALLAQYYGKYKTRGEFLVWKMYSIQKCINCSWLNGNNISGNMLLLCLCRKIKFRMVHLNSKCVYNGTPSYQIQLKSGQKQQSVLFTWQWDVVCLQIARSGIIQAPYEWINWSVLWMSSMKFS